jgi:acetoin utilization deacetylase AcuC-like enzyme
MPPSRAHRWPPWGRSRQRLTVFHDPAYWYPLSGLEQPTGVDPRRAELALWYLLDKKVLRPAAVQPPLIADYADLGLVHDAAYLESLTRPEVLARIFAIDSQDIPVDELLRTVRLACGGTIAAARAVLRDGGAALNLLGGFHHAGPKSGGGFCALNDIAVALAVARREGLIGRVVVVDLDAHPPDGTAECLSGKLDAWLGSLSGADWGPLPGVDETVLPEGCPDEPYLKALDALLGRMPPARLAFVLAGGDVLARDRLGKLGLSLDGVRERDRRVLRALGATPSVWLPAGGYSDEAWKALAGTALVLAGRGDRPISERSDPLHARFTRVSSELEPKELSANTFLTSEELDDVLHVPHLGKHRFLGYYSKEGLEYALSRYGVWQQIQRLGFERLRIDLGAGSDGERIRILGTADGQEHSLIDVVLDRKHIGGDEYLYVNWLTLRNPRGRFSDSRPALPGQDVPGLGLAREVSELLALIAARLGLKGVAFRPSWYHMAYAARRGFRFIVPERQGRFDALIDAAKGVPLLEATQAVAQGRVQLNGQPYAWEAEEMVQGTACSGEDVTRQQSARAASHFALS